MPGQSQLYLNVFKLERKFQDYLQGKPGSSAKIKQLKMGLLRALETGVTDPKLKRIASRIHGGKTLLKRILKQIGRSYAIPKAIYDHVACGTGIKKACTRWGCTPSDINAAEKLAINVGRKLGSFAQGIDPAENDWVADVEGDHEELIVHVSDRALEDMLLAGIEGYQVPKNQSTPFTEVYGICLGMVRDQRVDRKGKGKYLIRHIHVVRAAVQIRARGTKNAVWPNRKSLAAQLVTAQSLLPHLEVIGDFHSHPYLKADKLRKDKGWEFSNDDYYQNREWVTEMRQRNHQPRVGFIIAIGRKKHSGSQPIIKPVLPHVKFLQVDQCLIALATYRILRDGWDVEKGIELIIPAINAG